MTAALGRPLDRRDGHDKVTGRALYAADHGHDRLVHAVLVQSPIARGTITAIEAEEARRVRGVLTILSHENAPRLSPPKADSTSPQEGKMGERLLPFSSAAIHFAGQHVAVVVAETLEAANEAADEKGSRRSPILPSCGLVLSAFGGERRGAFSWLRIVSTPRTRRASSASMAVIVPRAIGDWTSTAWTRRSWP